MRIYLLSLIMLFSLTGCISIVEVQPTETWEGHYMTVEEFQSNTSNIELDEGTSIWVLSNHTLKRLLKKKEK